MQKIKFNKNKTVIFFDHVLIKSINIFAKQNLKYQFKITDYQALKKIKNVFEVK